MRKLTLAAMICLGVAGCKHRNRRQAPRPALSPGQWLAGQSALSWAALSEQPLRRPAGRLAQGTATCRTGVANSYIIVLASHSSDAAPRKSAEAGVGTSRAHHSPHAGRDLHRPSEAVFFVAVRC